jgi:mono/diheme cytochrome c family protein
MPEARSELATCLLAATLTLALSAPTPGGSAQASRGGGERNPERSRPTQAFEARFTPARLARGRYLVEGPAHCFMCHSEIDCRRGNCQPAPGKKGSGAIVPVWEGGFEPPYRLVCPNITPDRKTGAGAWTDAQLARAIREGIGHDGRALFPHMPYGNFRGLTDEDLASIIVYIRSIPPVYHPLPKTSVPKEIPVSSYASQEPTLPPVPANASALVRRGAYLVRVGNCSGCHTPVDSDGRSLPGMFLAGGQVYEAPWGTFATANITPDPSGISWYTEDIFIKTIRTGHVAGPGGRRLDPFMPWSYHRHLSDADLKAIFAYLRTVKPVRHRVDNTVPPTYCCLCKGKHGLGYMNCPPYTHR